MKNKQIALFFLAMLAIFFLTGCTNENQPAAKPETIDSNAFAKKIVEKVEVIHFHGNQQCASCIAVGKYAEETVNKYFAGELASGKISFAHVNAELPENKELAAKYGVTSASLWIGVYASDGFHKEHNVQVWYKINNEEEYLNYLKGILEKRLNGDFN